MSAWGAGPFENDEALDFLDGLEASGEAPRLDALAAPLQHVAHSGDYLEGPDVTEAVAAAAFIWLFSVRLDWLPVVGAGAGGLDTVRHLTLPAASLSILSTAYVARVARTSVRAELGSHYVETAAARLLVLLATHRYERWFGAR